MNTATAYELIDLVKSSFPFDGKDMYVSLNQLINLDHNVHPDELVCMITEIPDVRIADRGFIIPKIYFE